METLAISFTQLCQCLSDETLKAFGPFYLVSMTGEVKIPHRTSIESSPDMKLILVAPEVKPPTNFTLEKNKVSDIMHFKPNRFTLYELSDTNYNHEMEDHFGCQL